MLAITSGDILPQVFPKVKGFFRGISKKPSPKERVAPFSAPPNPRPLLPGEGGPAGPGVEGTPESQGQAPMNAPPPEAAFPYA